MFAPGPEIHEYLRTVAQDFDVRTRHVRFNSEVIAARWTGSAWSVTDGAGEEAEYDVLVSAIGLLHHPKYPTIPGIESFEGDLFHTAKWEDVPLAGRRVGVLGTGSSGSPVVSTVAEEASSVLHFARTPQWMLPMINPRYRRHTKRLLGRVPGLNGAAYHGYLWLNEFMDEPPLAPGWRRRLLARLSLLNLRRVRDPGAAAAVLTPRYEFGCKRVLVSGRYYKAVQEPHVSVIPTEIDHVDATGLTTADGVHHEVDVIVLPHDRFRVLPAR